ncbi:hypothetical protein GYMLUDRAFT_251649 [Collybiopsis luxurians FD-317 M1]|uniref:Unplaced genomic scaffold GYMLUscaffold_104, whole genome shotgun sequence n=1 Tax=Collybiopsis luxurians FD-317 M1 TaxID=944289 RepID=A0A0D0ANP9_9AGAR|nr:hypothetical protein GYMLUDRAFT_251649 [Collybiopsis luxurians FD-317 M1]
MTELELKTVDGLLQHFANLGYVSAQQVAARKLSICLIIEEGFLPQDDTWDEHLVGESGRLSVASATGHTSSTSAHRNRSSASLQKRKLTVQESHSSSNSRNSSERLSAIIHTSAFRPRVFYSRKVLLQTFKFKKVAYDAETRQFSVEPEDKEIMLSLNWQHDLEQRRRHERDSCYIGSGYSKNVFYARVEGKEYAFAQHNASYSEEENSKFLQAEFENLADASLFAEEFKAHLRQEACNFQIFISIMMVHSWKTYEHAEHASPLEWCSRQTLSCGSTEIAQLLEGLGYAQSESVFSVKGPACLLYGAHRLVL